MHIKKIRASRNKVKNIEIYSYWIQNFTKMTNITVLNNCLFKKQKRKCKLRDT